MRVSLLSACLAAALVAPRLSAQTNVARMANDSYTRSHDYDLVHQQITLSRFDWDEPGFDGLVATTVVALRPGLDSLILDAGHLLKIRKVTDLSGADLRFTTAGDTLVVFPESPVAFHDTLTFTVGYHAVIDNGRGLTFIKPEGQAHRPQQIWSQGEAANNHDWFPTYDFPNDKMAWDLVATVPQEYTVISNGDEVSDQPADGGMHTVHWRQTQPTASYLVSLIVAPLAKIHDTWHNVPVDYYVYHQDSTLAWRLFHPTVDMIDVYSRLTGVQYPWAKYAQTTVADFFGGMENVSATTLVDWLPDARAYQDRPWYSWILIPHELAHQWFGDYVTTENWANMWLNEGFAEFLPGQYWLERLGPQAADDYYVDEYDQFMRIDARQRTPLAALRSNNIYPKGALVLRMLKKYLGPDRFWASIHTYLQAHALDNATTDDLRQAILDATGENLDRFWDEWVYGAGYPEFRVRATYDSTARTLTLAVAQTQTDTATADSTGLRYRTASVFHMPVEVRVGTTSGDIVRGFTLDAREQDLVVDGLTAPPTYVVFDDGNTILKTLDFDQPTAWLAAQLDHEPDLWNRTWVIDRLADRKDDSLAMRALARAATEADYYKTRAHAAQALAAFGDGALPALQRALRDTSAQVRAAAVGALGDVGGTRATALASATFRTDSSYAVRAAAVRALATAKAPGLPDVIRAGIETPSYRDQIQQAALGAVVQSGDTLYAITADSLLPTNQVAGFVLAELANKGSGTALNRLTSRLNDDRAYVRRRAATAFGRVHPDLALPKLQAAERKLKHDDIKPIVERVMARMRESTAAGG